METEFEYKAGTCQNDGKAAQTFVNVKRSAMLRKKKKKCFLKFGEMEAHSSATDGRGWKSLCVTVAFINSVQV